MKRDLKFMTRTAILLALTIAFQAAKLPQTFTGPAVNAMLFVAASVVGIGGGVLIGTITPAVALAVGILKPVLAPAVPFVMIANASLVVSYGLLQRSNQCLGIVVAAVIKFLVLFIATQYILVLSPKISVALQFPQLLTALIGGLAAFLILKALRAAGLMDNEKTMPH